MGYELTKDLDYYEEGRKNMGFGGTKGLKLYENTQEQVHSDNDASEVDILGHFGTFYDILGYFMTF